MGCSPLLVFVLSINQEEKGLLQPMLNALVPRVNKAILLEWLGVLFFLFYTSWLPRQGLRKRQLASGEQKTTIPSGDPWCIGVWSPGKKFFTSTSRSRANYSRNSTLPVSWWAHWWSCWGVLRLLCLSFSPTRKKRPVKAKKESGARPANLGSELVFYQMLNAAVPAANKAILLEWLGIIFSFFSLRYGDNHAKAYASGERTTTIPSGDRRWVAVWSARKYPSLQLRNQSYYSSSSTPTASKSGGAVHRLLAAVAHPSSA